jgi:hypothetical protein
MIVNQKARTVLAADAFPARPLIETQVSEAGFELHPTYEGSSMNPFLAEAFAGAVISGKTDVFVNKTIESRDESEIFRLRFGFPPTVWKDLKARFNWMPLTGESLYSVIALIGLSITDDQYAYKVRPVSMSRVISEAQRAGQSPFFSAVRLNSVCGALADLATFKHPNREEIVAQLVGAFSSAEIAELRKAATDSRHYGFAVKMNRMGYTEVSEIVDNITSVPIAFLEEMFKG